MASEDRAALVALFRSAGGTRWHRNKNWDTGADLSQWYGVHVKHDGRVVELWLSSNNLEGTIPEALGVLTELKYLRFNHNKLTGSIPVWLGFEKNLRQLVLSVVSGPIPEALGALKELTFLELGRNKLTGPVPAWLGSQKKLRQLGLGANQLTGPIPEALGALKELAHLYLGDNKLMGSIPTWLGSLVKLEWLWLQSNQLVGHVPKELGNLKNLRKLYLHDNHLSGVIPTELANLSALSTLKYQTNAPKSIWRRRKKLTGGPRDGEGLDSWRTRVRFEQRTKPRTLKGDQRGKDAPVPPPPAPTVLLPQQQQIDAGDETEEDAPVLLDSPNQRQEVVAGSANSTGRASTSPEKAEEVDRLFRAQLVSSAGLDSLIRENPAALENIQLAIERQVAGSFYPDNELGDMQSRRNLGTLVTMSTALGEVALRHTEDMNVQRKELALPPFSKAYYTAIRTGLCKAYLAASAIDSDWVITSKTGGMGKVGAALKLMSSAVPLIGGLPKLAGKALEAGDTYLQTRRLVKITAMAPDTVECCSLARRLALQLTDGLRNNASATDDDNNQVWVNTTAGGSGCGRGADMMPGDMSEEDVFKYLLEEVTADERNDHGGKRLGKRHLRKLLKAIQGGCLDGSNGTVQKIKILLLEILPEADDKPAATPGTPKEVMVRSPPAGAAAHDSGLPSRAEFAAIQAELAALKSAKDKQQAELEEQQAKLVAVESVKEKQQAELEALKSGRRQQKAELEGLASAKDELERKVKKLEQHVPELDSEPDDDVDFGGELALRRRVAVSETAKGFLDRARDRAARAVDHHPVTVSEQREFEALQDEKHREHEARLRELEGQIIKATIRQGRR
ncbi:Hypothetical leucine rich repeat protein [Ectocarpus siliculosus]|uniref:Hypothetical leucine rich repeat protein n=1 Tax=Ectocarpus siliculosus TaxID=2880 RepID=D7FHA3_ECTSI|nr:Hypothetical leucine rich repeat protein [Ectocarpus siliculosus]|eukprot:CBJ28474.1 Hypothetical leucine rich repeat protein [Ectocarpus siliculosus]